MFLKQKLQVVGRYVRSLPLRAKLLILLLAMLLAYGLIFMWPTTVQLNYGGESCVQKLTLLPSLHRTVDDSRYTANYHGLKKVGGKSIIATQTCFTPTTAPTEGKVMVQTAPWGGWLARQAYALQVGSPPQASLSTLQKPIPATKPIEITLSEPDAVFEYELAIADKATDCDPAGVTVTCDIEPLALAQGKTYPYELNRTFDSDERTTVGEGQIQTLTAVQPVETSVKNEQTVYDKPKQLTLTTDKPLVSANAKLEQVVDDNTQLVAAKVTVDGTVVTVTPEGELERDADYQLTFTQAEATDGSTMLEPHTVRFSLSGGPKVTGVSIGTTRIAQSAQIVITFDQDIADKQDFSKLITVKGGQAKISKISNLQIRVSLQSLPRCQEFTVTAAKGLLSKHEVPGTTAWSHSARTICHSVSKIGSSRQGRAIYAYTFGDKGAATLYVGALHGNEASTSYILNDWINELESNPSKLAGRRVVIVPTANPDGLAARSRDNAQGVDLNRNFPTDDWARDTRDNRGVVKDGGGTEPLSEPEAQALANLSKSLRPRLMVSFHAVGSVVIGDVGGYSASYAARYASLTNYRNATGQSSSTFDYNVTGSYESWTIEKVGIPSMIVELGSYSYRNFNHHRNAFWAMLD